MQKPYKGQEFEERTLNFALNVLTLVKKIPSNQLTNSYLNQIVRSSSSIGANYLEANQGLTLKDAIHRLRISRKEAKETVYWLRLLKNQRPSENTFTLLVQEAMEIIYILTAMIDKTTLKEKTKRLK